MVVWFQIKSDFLYWTRLGSFPNLNQDNHNILSQTLSQPADYVLKYVVSEHFTGTFSINSDLIDQLISSMCW